MPAPAPPLTDLLFKPSPPQSLLPLSPAPLMCTKPHRRPPLPKRLSSSSFSLSASFSSNTTSFRQLPHLQNPKPEEQFVRDEFEEERVIGDCLVFEEGAFEGDDPFLPPDPGNGEKKTHRKKHVGEVEAENLVPERWKEAVAEINLTKKEKRKIAQELKFGSRIERRKKLPVTDMEEYLEYRSMKLSQLKPVVLDNPREFPPPPQDDTVGSSSGRVAPRNPRLQVSEGSLDAITDFFNSSHYAPSEDNDDKKPQGRRKLFTQEEKVLLNKRIPTLGEATSSKWLPLHTLSASGEFYLLDVLLKHNVDINCTDKDGLCAIHRAILGKKQAIINYLLRESANPFVRDNDGATLMHYAVQTAASQTIKILLLYNVDINLSDNDGWTPLHLAVQTKQTDIVRLLLIKGADKSLKNQDGLTPLDLCLYTGQNKRTYELIKLLKKLPRSK